MKVLVTGGAGFIGSHLVEALVARGDSVTVLDNFDDFYSPAIKRENAARETALGRVEIVEGDIRKPEDVRRALGAAGATDAVVHLAARAGVRPSIEHPLLYSQVNVDGTTVMLEQCRQLGVRRFVFGSSSSVYGARSNPPFKEDDRIDRPVSPYAATKIAGELLCSTFTHLYGLQTIALRFFTVYGPRQRPDLAIAKFSRLIRSGQKVPFFGNGGAARDYTFVEDIVRGILRAVDVPWTQFEVINLGGYRPVRLDELVAELERALGRKAELERLPDQPGDVPLTAASVEKAHRVLGWKAEVTFPEGLRRYATWLDGLSGP